MLQLKEKNKTLENDRMSLSAVNMALRKDMEAMGDKQRHMEEEKGRLTHQLNHLQDQVRKWIDTSCLHQAVGYFSFTLATNLTHN